jgi:hypothetical protein
MRVRFALCPLLTATLVIGCDDGATSDPVTPDAAADVGVDDTTVDDTSEPDSAAPDASADASPDAAPDAVADVLPDVEPPPDPGLAEVDPAVSGARRLTRAHYAAAVRQALGADLVVPSGLEPDVEDSGLVALGAAKASVSPRGVEQYERASYVIAEQVVRDAARRAEVLGCEPASGDDACMRGFVERVGRLLWRRPLATDEIELGLGVAAVAADTLDDPLAGAEYALAWLLQSPDFLYRAEVGEETASAEIREIDAYERATRLSFFLFDSPPDAALLDAAERGDLDTAEGYAELVDAMLADPRLAAGVRNFFTELYGLHHLEEVTLDPTLFVHFGPDVAPAAREETLRGVEELVLVEDGDYRDLFIRTRTWVDRKLASIYGVRAPAREGFGPVEFTREDGRRGLLGQASFLMLHSHPVSTSATLRGKFVRETVLCGVIAPPPVNVNTALPEPSGTTRTLRDRVAEHLVGEECRACHLLMDPIGLGFENFDAIGRWRELDNDAEIDPSGDIDGTPFADAWDMGQVLHDHPAVPTCLVRNMYRYALGRLNGSGDREQVTSLVANFEYNGFSVKALMRAIALSRGFAIVAAPTDEEAP